ncbi:diguanylate cyclase [Salinisphaera sp. SPP-AMP-43]|uniref:diguanylate cyclase n=1 Tax=Salinisphaera sp. SPP-AMP-43 TaxID=3121288 RepID=UPI003C6E6A68
MNANGQHLRIAQVLRDDGLTRLVRIEPSRPIGGSVLVKYRSGAFTPAKAVCLRSDYEILSRYALACALPLERFDEVRQETILRFRDPGGQLLSAIGGQSTERRLDWAIRMTQAVDELHQQGLLHRDLRADSFLLADDRVYITDFSQAVRAHREYPDLQLPDSDLRRLRYIAPELTGRFNAPADFRADYYSLGVVFYELFTGRLPFTADEPYELLYQHLAVEPPAPEYSAPGLPSTLSRILLRLLSKDPGRRYQCTHELIDHLRLARDVVRGVCGDDVERIPLRCVKPFPFDAAERLYGRDNERRVLLAGLERAFQGRPQVVWVSGSSGIGKSTLIRETYLPATRYRAIFVSGKFSLQQQDLPYGAWRSVMDALVRFVLAEPAEALIEWRARIRRAAGAQLGMLVALVPMLATLISEIPDEHSPSPEEVGKQLAEAFMRVLGVFADTQRPLVVFLDDLQWIDDASLGVLARMVSDQRQGPLLLIGAYRDDEIAPAHPLAQILNEPLGDGGLERHELRLASLARCDVTQLLSEGMQRTPEQVQPLVDPLLRRTNGNPFFLWQLLRTMHHYGWLSIDRARWVWDLEAMQQAEFGCDVFGLMQHRIRGLPERSQRALAWAACLGRCFDIEELSWVVDRDRQVVQKDLQAAVDEEFIQPVGAAELVSGGVMRRRFRFLHDRIQEAAYRSIPEDDIAERHHRIATLLYERLSEAEAKQRIIEIAGHMNRARQRLYAVSNEVDFARLNLQAANKAKAAGAFGLALSYLRQCMAELPSDLWDRDPGLAHALYRDRGELEYLDGDYEAAECFLCQAIERETDSFRGAELYRMRVMQLTLRAEYGRAVAVARQGLVLLEEPLPESDLWPACLAELAIVRDGLNGRSWETLGRLPPMQNARVRAVVRLLTSLAPPCYSTFPELWSLVVARAGRLCLEYGSLGSANYIYPALGGLLIHAGIGTGPDCRALDAAVQQLMTRFDDPAETSTGHLMVGGSLRHWFAPMRTALEDYRAAEQAGQISGHLQYAVYAFAHRACCRYFQGDPLDELMAETLGSLESARARRNHWGIDLLTGAMRVFELLHAGNFGPDWPGRHEPEANYLARCQASCNEQVICIYHVMRAYALLIRDAPGEAAYSLREAERRLALISVQGLLAATQFPVLKVLAAIETPAAAIDPGASLDRLIAETLARYRDWADSAPDNFSHWYRLLLAEQAGRADDLDTLISNYDAALAAAQQQGCWPAIVLIARRAERFWQQRGHTAFAAVYGRRQRQALQIGHAAAVVTTEDDERPALDPAADGARMNAVIKIAQALSLHTDLEELVPEIIRHVARQTGAQRVVLLLAQGDTLQMAMDSGLEQSHYYRVPRPLESTSNLPHAVIRYVARSQRMLRFGPPDIQNMLLLNNDPYFTRDRHAESSGFHGAGWCVPLSYLGQLLGILYLEHERSTTAFDAHQAPLVEFLAAQAAISIRSIELTSRLADEGQARRQAEMRMQSADAEIMARQQQVEQFEKLANTDDLTELANRRLFMEVLQITQAHGETTERPVSVLMLDIDCFKTINDRHGHAVGDEVLRHIAGLFPSALRDDDLAARIGGEEFAVLLRDTGLVQAMEIAERLCRQVDATPLRLDSEDIAYTVSVGVAQIETADASYEAVLRRADSALYRAKANGRNQVSG